MDENAFVCYSIFMKQIVLPVILLTILCSCDRHPAEIIPRAAREDLFSLEIGRMEDQIALYNAEGHGLSRNAHIAMRDGLFYISDGLGGKILHYNTYGELLFMIYNEETNPPPMSLRPLQDNNLVTRWAVSYPLNEPGEIAVDSRKHIYVRDRLPADKHSYDIESNALLNNVIIHFDENGRFVEYLGRNGIGGTPFPWVEGIYTSVDDELAVVCRLPNGWDIYWFGNDGSFIYMVQFKDNMVPIPPGMGDPSLITSLDAIAAAPDSRHLYVKIDYYKEILDNSGLPLSIEYESSWFWIMNVEDGSWEGLVPLPPFESAYSDNNRQIEFSMPYAMQGVFQDGGILLFAPLDEGYDFLFLIRAENGIHEQKKCLVQVGSDELEYNAFSLSADGILSGLLLGEWEVKLVWWRTDLLIGTESA